ncbi:hypothetical protein PG993_001389 [Apiospora rasikravindrae]|uniref:Protein arginine N-methyltransferase 2 n=1 Tax=Apiospora rasikravindrae TaxID=990691 RepID=A0ABR1UB91_9PEZI
MGEPSNNQDALEARIPPSCPASISQILTQAWNHDLASLKPLLDVPGRASVQEPTTGETPLHASIRSCGPGAAASDLKAAEGVLEELFFNGAIWNDVDSNNETPGCVAARLGQAELYDMCVGAGVRAELLFGLLEGYEELESMDEDDNEDEEVVDMTSDAAAPDGEEVPDLVETNNEGHATEKQPKKTEQEKEEEEEEETEILESNPDRAFVAPSAAEAQASQVDSAEYLRSNLTYSAGKLTDDAANGVMMEWETSIMRASVDTLLPEQQPGRKVLNIGFGMGIIDGMFAATKPARHHIIEAHPDVLSHIATSPDCQFGPAWEASAPEQGAYKVHAGKWQDVVPKLLEAGETYDAVYFDTFGEDYAQLRMFFTEHVPGLLEEEGRFGFFNGLGADRQICYDVYTKVVEMHLSDAGMDVAWQEMDVDMQGLQEEGKGEWEGVKRRYWTLNSEYSYLLVLLNPPFLISENANEHVSQNTGFQLALS